MPAIDLTVWLLVFLRVGAMFAVFPVFSLRSVPARVRLALAVVTAALLSNTIGSVPMISDSLLAISGVCLVEIGIGLLLGFVSRIVFFGLDFAGALMATEIGLALPPVMDPTHDSPTTPPTTMLHYLAMMLWLSLDLHHWMILAMRKTYALLPLGGGGVLREDTAAEIITRTGQTFWMAVQMAAPVLAVSFLITVVLSVLGRAVPQMNVFGESFAFRILGGLIVFSLTLPLAAQHITNYLRRLPEDMLRVAQLVGGG